MVGTSRPEPVPIVERRVDAEPPGDREQMHDRIGRAADRAVDADGVLERLARQDLGDAHDPRCTISTMRRPARCASTLAPRIDRRDRRRCPAVPMPSASTIEAMVEAVPMVMQWPARARHAGLGVMKSASVISPAFTSSPNCQTSVPEPTSRPLELAVQHRPAGDARSSAGRSSPRPSAAPAWSCRSRPAARRRRSDCRGSIPRRPCWRGCGTASRSGAGSISPSDITGNSTGKPPAS